MHTLTCNFCKKEFTHRKDKKYCTKECYFKSKNKDVTLTCETCKSEFTVAYRFRTRKYCGQKCMGKSHSKSMKKRVIKTCLKCNKEFDVIPYRKDDAKYCSYECFLSTRETQQPDVTLKCEYCSNDFVVPYPNRNRRFCSKSCANSGENNSFYGLTGITHPRFNKPAWNNGLTTSTDERVFNLGRKISEHAKLQFSLGNRSNAGKKNPNYGNTSETLSDEKRRNFSIAACNRVKAGVSGYKTGHITGQYQGSKAIDVVLFKSSWELIAMMIWDTDPNILQYEYEPIVFELPNGSRTIPDFLVTRVDKTKFFVEIKPTSIQRIQEVNEKLNLTKRCVEQNTGYEYVLYGDEIINDFKKQLGDRLKDELSKYQDRC